MNYIQRILGDSRGNVALVTMLRKVQCNGCHLIVQPLSYLHLFESRRFSQLYQIYIAKPKFLMPSDVPLALTETRAHYHLHIML